jgi:hypothetical protein
MAAWSISSNNMPTLICEWFPEGTANARIAAVTDEYNETLPGGERW